MKGGIGVCRDDLNGWHHPGHHVVGRFIALCKRVKYKHRLYWTDLHIALWRVECSTVDSDSVANGSPVSVMMTVRLLVCAAMMIG